MEKNQREERQRIYAEIVPGRKEWRAAHPKATLRESEQEARKRVSRLEVYLIEESAMENPSQEWTGHPSEQRPTCPPCGEALVARGKHVRTLQATAGREVSLERSYGTCPRCQRGGFPPR